MTSFAGEVALITGGSRGIQAAPKGRVGTPEDIAKVILFLCSDEAEWICGQTMVADGGLTLTALSPTA